MWADELVAPPHSSRHLRGATMGQRAPRIQGERRRRRSRSAAIVAAVTGVATAVIAWTFLLGAQHGWNEFGAAVREIREEGERRQEKIRAETEQELEEREREREERRRSEDS
jgi:hypothetical protein